LINITCPCLYPVILTIIDEDGDKTTYWSIPDDELDNEKFKIPQISDITQNGKEYVAVMWSNPKNKKIKETEVNDHIVYSGCDYDELIKKNGKMKCEELQLYIVLHPKLEWENYHIRELKS
jgi:hypothetical protein